MGSFDDASSATGGEGGAFGTGRHFLHCLGTRRWVVPGQTQPGEDLPVIHPQRTLGRKCLFRKTFRPAVSYLPAMRQGNKSLHTSHHQLNFYDRFCFRFETTLRREDEAAKNSWSLYRRLTRCVSRTRGCVLVLLVGGHARSHGWGGVRSQPGRGFTRPVASALPCSARPAPAPAPVNHLTRRRRRLDVSNVIVLGRAAGLPVS